MRWHTLNQTDIFQVTSANPLPQRLTELGITYTRNVTSDPTFLDHYTKYFGPWPYGRYATAQLLGGRLVPRSVVEKNHDGLRVVMRDIVENSAFYVAASALGVNQNPNKAKAIPANAVLPAWRDGLPTVLVPSPWDFTLPRSAEEQGEAQLTDSLISKLTARDAQFGDVYERGRFSPGNMEGGFLR